MVSLINSFRHSISLKKQNQYFYLLFPTVPIVVKKNWIKTTQLYKNRTLQFQNQPEIDYIKDT